MLPWSRSCVILSISSISPTASRKPSFIECRSCRTRRSPHKKFRKREHITPILFALHWLPVRQRIQYKILTLVYSCLNQQAPAYLSTCITPYVPGRSLRSSDHGLLTEHRYRLERYLRPPLFHRCRPSSVERTADPSERMPILPVLQGHTKNSTLPPSLQGPRVVLVTFKHFKLFYLLCFYNYVTMHFNK